MKKLITLSLSILALSSYAQVPYKVIAPVPDAEDGTIVYLVDWDKGEKIDSVAVKDHKALFTGDIDEPIIARITSGSGRYGTFVLEQGTCTINQQTKTGVGTMLNDILKGYIDQLSEMENREINTEEELNKLVADYSALEMQIIGDNIDNPIAAYIFTDLANILDADEIMAVVNQYPDLKESKRVQSVIDSVEKKLATSPGKMFTDFAITYKGETKKLSDYVGKGDYVLVDFFASWCGPCMREIETLRDIYNTYTDKGLKILGVAVWDEPEDTEACIKRKNIPWECIIDAQTIPTDLYGINGIPCVILFGPDGTILARDKQGVELKNAVASALD